MITEMNKFLKFINLGKQNLSGKVYFVGGCVRDFFREKTEAHDIDIVVNFENGAKILANYIYSVFDNIREKELIVTAPLQLGHYPIYSLTFKNNFELNGQRFNLKDVTIEIADTMCEDFLDGHSRQREVSFATLQEDIYRRDFTINAGLIDVETFKFVNLSLENNIIDDIKKGIIKCNKRDEIYINKIFSNDPLRILRGCVFAARFNFKIDNDVKERMIENVERLKIVSRERINSEIKKALEVQGGLYRLVCELDSINALEIVFPGINILKTIAQFNVDDHGNLYPDVRNIHLEGDNVFKHVLNVIKYTKAGYELGLAALYHDVGKLYPEFKNGKIRFINHENIGAKMIPEIFSAMKIDNETIKNVQFLVKNHMKLHKLKDFSKKSLRRFIREIPSDKLRFELYELCNADCLGTTYKDENGIIGPMSPHYEVQELLEKLIKEENIIVEKPFRYFNGNEIMKMLNISGKAVGEAINYMLELQDIYGFKKDKNFIADELKKKFKPE